MAPLVIEIEVRSVGREELAILELEVALALLAVHIDRVHAEGQQRYSHSIVAGGFDDTS